MLIAQRKFTKKNNPGKWGPSVAGTNDKGETYETNIVREAAEEIGLTNTEFIKIREPRLRDGKHKHFTQWFLALGDWTLNDFTPQESEVENLALIDIDELSRDIDETPEKYLGSMGDTVRMLKKFLEDKE